MSDIFLEISTNWCKFQASFGQVKNSTSGKYYYKQQRVISVKILFVLYRQKTERDFLPVLRFLRKIICFLNYLNIQFLLI